MARARGKVKKYEIHDDFLDADVFDELKSIFINNVNFPWYYYSGITSADQNEKDKHQFVHTLYAENIGVTSDFFRHMTPLLQRINVKNLIRIKANLGLRTDEHIEGGWHTDFDFDCKTAIFYLNTNNGYTLLEDDTKVESVANRFVTFDSSVEHSGVSHTDTKVRCLLNINYL